MQLVSFYPVLLEGDRLLLREFQPSDLVDVHLYAGDPFVTRYMTWGPNTSEETRAFLEQVMQLAREEPRMTYELAVTLRDTGELIGGAGLRVHSVEHRNGDIGYILRRDCWGRGYATEAARLLLHFGFDRLGLHRIWATCDPENIASIRVLQKIGMQWEGRIRHQHLVRGRWRDSELYAILKDEWRGMTALNACQRR
ncbi:MAG: GNAT family N-acetyltransferase [Thermus sp.]